MFTRSFALYRWASTSAGLMFPTVRAWAEQAASPLGSDGASFSYLVQLVVGLIVVIGAIIAAAWLLKRVNRFSSAMGGEMQILGGLSMGPRERLVLVQVGREQILIGVAPGHIRMLHVLGEPIDTAATEGGQTGFSERLNMVMKRGQDR